MALSDDMPISRVDPVTRVGAVLRGQRVGAIQLPPGVVLPVGQRLLSAWQRRREGRKGSPDDAEEAPVAVDPPETYGEHGELHPAHGGLEADGPWVDLTA
jgi:hypothetical protein